ncbi:tripartite tricarboxylate transporter substrate binding protein [Pusillimonas sp. TS35]|nr:tripartite tricarboxylate transporter substrate binding protein [Pusillimonas sp. TS35]
MKRILYSMACSAMVLSSAFAAPPTYPDKPLRLLVPAAPGGAADTLARAIGQRLGDKFGQPVVIENKPGAAAIIGMTAIANAPPDGYTLGMTFSGAMSINPSLYKSLPYDPLKDFDPIAIVAISPLVIATTPELGVKNLSELLTLAKKSPDALTFGSAGNGSTQHLSMEMLKATAGVNMLHVPYKGSSAALIDVQSGRVSAISDNAMTLIPLIQAGKLTPIAVETAERVPSLPNLPTVAESGYPGYEAAGWYGLIAPVGTPKHIVSELNTAIGDMLNNTDFTNWLRQQGMEPKADSADGFRDYILKEKKKWAQVIQTAQIPARETR